MTRDVCEAAAEEKSNRWASNVKSAAADGAIGRLRGGEAETRLIVS